ncbi:DNA-binding transcriptional regulator, LysR family [Lutimaribacter pacificus]|uniref:Transcriptional regulator, LysR family n=2 Tax=Lutimaribacter pacificus TaxID=391948 RepID=A0A1H0N6S9_9RHOB|nr:DNA-binding transcriptional regulator, LysR family [Lutimaribacter pacificus]SHK86431.1 transcriptional regulator, LysR family [Lutimaribacter pacificus]
MIDRHRSLRAVAMELGLTQPAVSQMVKDLEFAFGSELVDRSVRGVSLSPDGRIALQRTRAGLAAFTHLAHQLDSAQPPVLRIGTNPAVMLDLLPAALSYPTFAETGLRFVIRTGLANAMTHALWDGEIDCYVGRIDWDEVAPEAAVALRHDPLMTTELVVVCADTHPLASKSDLTVADLAGHTWALPPEDSRNRVAIDSGLRNNGLPMANPRYEIAADPNSLLILARRAGVLTVVPRNALDASEPGLVALDLPSLAMPAVQLGLFTLVENEQLSAVQILRDTLRKVARQTAKVTSI